MSSSATKVASKATENVVKYGGIASQKVVDISAHVGEKVCLVACFLFFFQNALCVFIFKLLSVKLFYCFFANLGERRHFGSGCW